MTRAVPGSQVRKWIAGVAVLVQVFCISCIIFTKVRHILKDRGHQYGNGSRRVSPISDVDCEVSSNTEQPNTRDSVRRKNTKQMKRIGIDGNENNPVESVLGEKKSRKFLNTTTYNKVLFEIYHLIFIIMAISIRVSVFFVKNNLNITELLEYSPILLSFLDVAPNIFLCIVLPIAIHVCNSEILKYIKRIFH